MKVLLDSKTSYLFKPIVDKILEEKLPAEAEEHSEETQSTISHKPESVHQVIAIDELPENFSSDFETFSQIFEKEQIDCLVLDLMAINQTKKSTDTHTIDRSSQLVNILSFIQRLELDRPVHLIGLSTVLTWNQTVNQSKKSKFLKEKQFKKRVCSAKYLQLKALEQSLLSSSQTNEQPNNLSIKIIARGLVYGQGESLLEPLFRAAWLLDAKSLPIVRSFAHSNSPVVPTPTAVSAPVSAAVPVVADEQSTSPAAEQNVDTAQTSVESTESTVETTSQPLIQFPGNLVPMVHVLDHATFVFHELSHSVEHANSGSEEEEAEPKYLIAVDQSINQTCLIKSIATMLGHGPDAVEVVNQTVLEEQLDNPAFVQPLDPILVGDSELVDWLTVDLQFEPSTKMKSLDHSPAESEESAGDDQSIAESTHQSMYCSIQGFLTNQMNVKQEFINQRNLKPVKIWVDGRPVTGKSRLVACLASQLSLPHLSISNLIDEAKSRTDALGDSIRQCISRFAEDQAEQVNQLKAQLSNKKLSKKEIQKIEQTISQSTNQSINPRLPVNLLVDIVRQKVESPICRNAGFVLDGFPRSLEEAKLLFDCEPVKQPVKPAIQNEDEQSAEVNDVKEANEEDHPAETESETTQDEAETSEEPTDEPAADSAEKSEEVDKTEEDSTQVADNPPKRNPAFFPLTVVSIQSTGQASSLKFSQLLSYDQLIVGHNDPEGIARRWQREIDQSNAQNAEQTDAGQIVPPFTYLSEIQPLVFSDESLNNLESVVNLVKFSINQSSAKPIFNYHPTPAELKKIADVEQTIKNEKEFEKRLINQRKLAAEQARMSAKKEREESITNSINKQEQERLEAASAPLRAYLIDNVLPAVVQGLTEVVTITKSNSQPVDPIEYLSEFLYRYALNAPLKRPALNHQVPVQPIVEEKSPRPVSQQGSSEESRPCSQPKLSETSLHPKEVEESKEQMISHVTEVET